MPCHSRPPKSTICDSCSPSTNSTQRALGPLLILLKPCDIDQEPSALVDCEPSIGTSWREHLPSLSTCAAAFKMFSECTLHDIDAKILNCIVAKFSVHLSWCITKNGASHCHLCHHLLPFTAFSSLSDGSALIWLFAKKRLFPFHAVITPALIHIHIMQ